MKNTNNSNVVNLFVYGTLRQSFGNHALLSHAKFLGKARTTASYVMYCSGHIPFVSCSQSISTILGEVYQIDALTLQRIDQLEGCYPTSPGNFDPKSWYTRAEIPVQWLPTENSSEGKKETETAITEQPIWAWMYFNEKETEHPIIASGDFADRETFLFGGNAVWYFAYGSNMNPQRMLDRGVFFRRRIKAKLPHYILKFNKMATQNPGYAFANIEPDPHETVEGILYEIRASDIAILDRYEGVANHHYVRVSMRVETSQGSVDAEVYVAHHSKIREGLCPPSDYLDHLIKGRE
jgi:gamma-glutamylcyclotransferase